MKSDKVFRASKKADTRVYVYERLETITFDTVEEVERALRRLESELRNVTIQKERLEKIIQDLTAEKTELEKLIGIM